MASRASEEPVTAKAGQGYDPAVEEQPKKLPQGVVYGKDGKP